MFPSWRYGDANQPQQVFAPLVDLVLKSYGWECLRVRLWKGFFVSLLVHVRISARLMNKCIKQLTTHTFVHYWVVSLFLMNWKKNSTLVTGQEIPTEAQLQRLSMRCRRPSCCCPDSTSKKEAMRGWTRLQTYAWARWHIYASGCSPLARCIFWSADRIKPCLSLYRLFDWLESYLDSPSMYYAA